MLLKEIREHAHTLGIQSGKRTKLQLIREIQRREGNFDCFATAYLGECDQLGCLWRGDCLRVPRQSRVAAS